MELHELLKFTSITARINATLDWLEKVHAHERPLQIVAFSNVFASTIGALLSILRTSTRFGRPFLAKIL